MAARGRKAKPKTKDRDAAVSPATPNKGGRPTAYDPAMCERVIQLGAEGKSKAQIARTLGVVRNTIDNWADRHPEFLSAIKRAQELALAWWEDKGQEGIGLGGKDFNATAFIFQMKNRFRDDYRDKTDHEHTGKDGTPLVPVLNVTIGRTEPQPAS